MKRIISLSRYLITLLLALLPFPLLADQGSPLQHYVETPDPSYGYQLVGELSVDGVEVYFLNMNSQSWRSADEVTPVVWNHWVTLIVPQQLSSSVANLIIVGGSTSAQPPEPDDVAQFALIATATGAIQVVVQQVPSQPLHFSGLSEGLTEDALVAYSWRRVMETGDPTWAAYLPMTKAAVRAMDTAQEFIASSLGLVIDRFIVTGFSKRGATAWLTAAVDDRVVGVVPGMFNILHMADQLEHHYASYGFFSHALSDYEENGVMENIRAPEGELLGRIVDPISYREALTMPHLILNASGDEFFLPDASERYIGELPAEALQRIVPNTDHSGESKFEDLLAGLIAWYQMQLYGLERPELEWGLAAGGELEVGSSQIPLVARLWQASNPSARDFRLETVGDQAWHSSVITADADGRYRVSVPEPAQGYTAYMVELTYPGAAGIPQVYTTSVFVTPDEHPFELEDPLLNPKIPLYWRWQLARALAGFPDDYTRSELEQLLPIRVLGDYVHDLETLDAFLKQPGAVRACTAARLNVEAEEVGWYSTLYTLGETNIKYWQPYARAEQLYRDGKTAQAAGICFWLTLL
ncbi:MAG: PhoPQ-activated protein PqaA family protein [Candidatus Thiodiazotropha sp.]